MHQLGNSLIAITCNLYILFFCPPQNQFWKICPIEHLLSRLERDSRPVSRRLVNLLFNSFLPLDQPEPMWCERCVALIQMNPAAARKFYQYAYMDTSPTNIGEVMEHSLHVFLHIVNSLSFAMGKIPKYYNLSKIDSGISVKQFVPTTKSYRFERAAHSLSVTHLMSISPDPSRSKTLLSWNS